MGIRTTWESELHFGRKWAECPGVESSGFPRLRSLGLYTSFSLTQCVYHKPVERVSLDFIRPLSNCSGGEAAFRPHGLVPPGVTDSVITASTVSGSTKSQVLHIIFLSELPRRSAVSLLGLPFMDWNCQICVKKMVKWCKLPFVSGE